MNYETDYYDWLTQTAKAVEEGRWSDIDAAQLAEELVDMSKSERRGIESHLERILTHILKIRYQPGLHTRSWDLSVSESRARLRKLFAENPSLEARIDELIADAYETARYEAAKETEIALDVFPEQCPYSAEDVMTRDWSGPETSWERLSRTMNKLK
jgi:hypothetical protein